MIRALAVSLIAWGFLSACAQEAPPPAPEPQTAADAMPQTAAEATAADACGASRFQHLIGTPLADIDPASLPEGARLLTPDAIVTQDFRPDRLNIMSGTDGLVSSLSCY